MTRPFFAIKGQTVVECWSCQQPSLLFLLPDVRRVKCPHCHAIHPSSTGKLVHDFYNSDKQAAKYL